MHNRLIITTKIIRNLHSTARIQLRTAATEICNNRIDDDRNGLTDEQEFSCYNNSNNPASCGTSSIIWACEAYGNLYWADINTGNQNHIGRMPFSFVDITWASDGKLYGCGGFPSGIYEIDPNTAQVQFVRGIDNYAIANAMTADAAGNLYVVAFSLTTNVGMCIIKVNLNTWDICYVANLNPTGLGSAGDLTFYNNMLYLTCTNSTIAKNRFAHRRDCHAKIH